MSVHDNFLTSSIRKLAWSRDAGLMVPILSNRGNRVQGIWEIVLIDDLHHQGLSISAIARQVGCDGKTVKAFPLIHDISCGFEVLAALVWSEEVADFSDGFDELIESSRANAPEMGFQLGECHFDGVEIRAAGRQGQEPAAMGFEHPGSSLALVGGEVVEDDDRPRLQLGDQNLFDIRVEGVPIHGSRDHLKRFYITLKQRDVETRHSIEG